MNYNSFLDTFFGNGWISFGIPFAIYILSIIIITKIRAKKKNNDKNNKRNWIYTILLYLVPMLILFGNGELNPIFLGYGKAVGISELRYIDGKLYVMDFTKTMGGKTSSGQKYYRINILDPETGEKEIRFQVCTGAQFLGVQKERIAISHYDDVTYYSNVTGKILARYSKKTLPTLFPELSMGVDKLRWEDDGSELTISALNGSTWLLNPETRKVSPLEEKNVSETYVPHIPSYRLYIDQNDIEIDDRDDGNGSDFVSLRSEGSNSEQKHIYDYKDSLRLKELFFLEGDPIAISIKDSNFVILHYETTEREKFILTCISLDCSKKIWELKQSALNPNYKITSYKLFHMDYDEKNGRLFFNLHNVVYAISMKDGKVLWKQKL